MFTEKLARLSVGTLHPIKRHPPCSQSRLDHVLQSVDGFRKHRRVQPIAEHLRSALSSLAERSEHFNVYCDVTEDSPFNYEKLPLHRYRDNRFGLWRWYLCILDRTDVPRGGSTGIRATLYEFACARTVDAQISQSTPSFGKRSGEL